MSWFHVTVAEGATELVTQVWQAAQRAGTDLRRQAVFKRRRSASNVALFFSPAAEGLARIFGAKRCPQPQPRGLELLVGADSAWPPATTPRQASAGTHGEGCAECAAAEMEG